MLAEATLEIRQELFIVLLPQQTLVYLYIPTS